MAPKATEDQGGGRQAGDRACAVRKAAKSLSLSSGATQLDKHTDALYSEHTLPRSLLTITGGQTGELQYTLTALQVSRCPHILEVIHVNDVNDGRHDPSPVLR